MRFVPDGRATADVGEPAAGDEAKRGWLVWMGAGGGPLSLKVLGKELKSLNWKSPAGAIESSAWFLPAWSLTTVTSGETG